MKTDIGNTEERGQTFKYVITTVASFMYLIYSLIGNSF